MQFEIGREYIDKGTPLDSQDQFMRWMNIPGVTGMMNSPGIRWLNYKIKEDLPAVLILITKTAPSSYHNPWDDVIDLNSGTIYYWGDAKFHATKRCEDFQGNRVLKKIWNCILEGRKNEIPPILHFSKPQRGKLIFNGLCVLDHLDLDWFEDEGKPVRNYRAILRILDQECVTVDWLHKRVHKNVLQIPSGWTSYIKGTPKYFKVWKKNILSKEDQLPIPKSPDWSLLQQVRALSPTEFERFCVAIMRKIRDVKHDITQTRPTRDGGFDFFGQFTLPMPLNYTISIKGEAKKYATNSPVGPKEVSRLAARLIRGEYGIFLTTSYYTKQAQEEIYEDGYPIHLICGSDIIKLIREFKLASGNDLNSDFRESLKEE